jgi:hypothetical protein
VLEKDKGRREKKTKRRWREDKLNPQDPPSPQQSWKKTLRRASGSLSTSPHTQNWSLVDTVAA